MCTPVQIIMKTTGANMVTVAGTMAICRKPRVVLIASTGGLSLRTDIPTLHRPTPSSREPEATAGIPMELENAPGVIRRPVLRDGSTVMCTSAVRKYLCLNKLNFCTNGNTVWSHNTTW